ncbi:transglutaminase-like domain-containing protein [Ruicaihuangia caeni]|uniref:transglutaminase-like domain-containing protein n=1 Tax=Ruicaihuangia caeni TaxID=3042517 RepID=UPI00338E4ECA
MSERMPHAATSAGAGEPPAFPEAAAGARPRRSASGRGAAVARALIATVFVIALAVIALATVWPIYRTVWLVVTAGGAMLAGAAIALTAVLRRWRWPAVLLAILVGYFALGLPLAMPRSLSSPEESLRGLVELAAAPVTAWKQLVTVSMPVGSYHALLVPAFILFLAASVVSFRSAWRGRLPLLVVVPWLVAQMFGIAFGTSASSESLRLGALALHAPREAALGAAGFAVAIWYLAWHARDSRRRALGRGARPAAPGLPASAPAVRVRKPRAPLGARLRRTALAGVVLLTAIAVAVPTASALSASATRDVLRTAVDPAEHLAQQPSPLAAYRGSFTDDWFDRELFRVTGEGEVDRLRLAVLGGYDGTRASVGLSAVSAGPDSPDAPASEDPGIPALSGQSSVFERVPTHQRPGDGARATLDIEILGYEGVWMPSAGRLLDVRFSGDRRDALSDGFFYDHAASAAVQLERLRQGDRYLLDVEQASEPVRLEALSNPRAPMGALAEVVPESLKEWVSSQRLGDDAAALAELISRLRERGYRSHALELPASGAEWARALPGYRFEPSLAGHSSDRIDALFTALIEKQRSTEAVSNERLVAAVGDDEQFAVAAALIARQLGFDARVVLGFVLDGTARTATGAPGIPACEDGVCRGGNLTAWVEVGGAGGEWAAVDATPQARHPLAPDDDTLRDPRLDTEVVPENAREQRPPQLEPSGGDERSPDAVDPGLDLSWLWPALTVAGWTLLALAVLSAPFLSVIAAKVRRRRRRRRAPDAASRVTGAWDEYVDLAVDHSRARQGALTREELAVLHSSPRAVQIARHADAAAFAPPGAVGHDPAAVWALVDAERAELAASAGARGRLRAAISLRSLPRGLRRTGSHRPVRRSLRAARTSSRRRRRGA